MAHNRFVTLSTTGLADEFAATGRDADAAFGRYQSADLNWKADAGSWSAAQCLEHLVKADRQMLEMIDRALDRGASRSIWQRLPGWSRLFGRMLVTSQSPGGKQKFKAPASARPAVSDVDREVLERFVALQQELIGRVRALSPDDQARVMVSPFVAQITYRVLDGYRLIAAHQRRHVEQAARIIAHPQFPARA